MDTGVPYYLVLFDNLSNSFIQFDINMHCVTWMFKAFKIVMFHRLIANKIIKQTFLCSTDCLIFCAISMWYKGSKFLKMHWRVLNHMAAFIVYLIPWGERRLFCENKFSIPQWQWEKNFLSPLEVYVSFDTSMLCKIQSLPKASSRVSGGTLSLQQV